MTKKICKVCGREFIGWRKTQQYCSTDCRKKDISLLEIIKRCPTCGKEFYTKDVNKIYCCNKCRNNKEIICEICGKVFISNSWNQKTCSPECKKELDKKRTKGIKCRNCGEIFIGHTRREVCDKCITVSRRLNARTAAQKWKGLSLEEKEIINNRRSQAVKNAIIDKTDEEREEWQDKKSQGLKKYYEGMSPSDYKIYHANLEQRALEREKETGYKWPCQMPQVRNSYKDVSEINLHWKELFGEIGLEFNTEYPIGGYSYDLGTEGTVIDIHPFAFHNVTMHPYNNPHPKNYHLKKIKYARERGYKSISIWDWDEEDKILNLLNPNKKNIGARECLIKELKYEEATPFINEFHLQRNIKKRNGDIYLGLIYNGELIECMSFGKPRFTNKYEVELLRLCTHKDYKVSGGASKLFKYFTKEYNPATIISYCDLSKFDGSVYEQLGFKLLRAPTPSSHRYNPKTKDHKTGKLLNDHGVDQIMKTKYGKGTSNSQVMIDNGYVEIYDCGQAVYVIGLDKIS